MTARTITLASGRKVALAEQGNGPPLLYLHDFADVHGARSDWLDFHARLADGFRLVAPAHPGCAGSDEDEAANTIDDVVFGLLEVLDALGLESMPVVGAGIGGWIAAELAVRHRRLVERLALIAPAGLYVPGHPIADIFMAVQPRDGHDHSDLRRLLFARADAPMALDFVPDGRGAFEPESLRYRMFRFAGRIGFHPPYLHSRSLLARLQRFDRPALIVAGERDALVPPVHFAAYADRLPAAKLVIFREAGHSLHIEQSEEAAACVIEFLSREGERPKLAKSSRRTLTPPSPAPSGRGSR